MRIIKGQPYKQKFYTLISLLVLLGLASYGLGFNKSITLIKSVKVKTEQAAIFANSDAQFNILTEKLNSINSVLNNGTNESDSQNMLLDISSEYCQKKDIIIVELSPPDIIYELDYEITTQDIKFQGVFRELIQLLNYLEKDKSIGEIISVEFFTESNIRLKRQTLFMHLIIKSLSNAN